MVTGCQSNPRFNQAERNILKRPVLQNNQREYRMPKLKQ